MHKRQFLLTLLTVGIAVGMSGCMAAAVGAAAAGTVAYVKGDLQSVEAKDLNSVYQATKKASEQLGLWITKDSKDAMTATIVARDAQDKKVIIKLAATAEGATKMSIRVGVFGSETKSRLIYDQIMKNLQ